MAEDFARSRQYEYRQNANLVLEAQRDSRRRNDEGTGEAESLRQKLPNLQMRMGERAKRERPAELETRLKDSKRRKEAASAAAPAAASGSTSILAASQDLDAINYVPRSRASRLAYEEILVFVQRALGDQPEDVLNGAGEETLALLKDDAMRDPERKKELEKLLGRMQQETFHNLVNLGKKITDFNLGDDAGANAGSDAPGKGDDSGALDDEIGVAVVFDDDDEDEEEDALQTEVMDSSDDDEDDLANTADRQAADGSTKRLRGSKIDEDDEDDEEDLGILRPRDIDAHWLQRGLSRYYDDANQCASVAEEVLSALAVRDERGCENRLVTILGFEKFDFIKVLLRNRSAIYYCTRLRQAQSDDERGAIEDEMRKDIEFGGPDILAALGQTETADKWQMERAGDLSRKARREARALRDQSGSAAQDDMDVADATAYAVAEALRPESVLDLSDLSFHQGSHLMSNKTCELPAKSWRAQKKGYEEVHVPALRHQPGADERLIPLAELPEWTHPAFKGMERLNRIQSQMKEAALDGAGNLLLCAPTGGGKTNCAMMCMLNVIGQYRRPAEGPEDVDRYDLDAFKIVYVAPMKALVQEVVVNFGKRLKDYGIKVKELSGDQSLTQAEIADTQVIVTTPEKWDIITRKSGDRTYTQLVRLIIIDEIHLLHDDRGPVLESLVARTLRQSEFTQESVRIVGLSATLPNYGDVAAFLRADKSTGLFFFDNSFRPVPLQQQYIGITEKKPLKRFQLMNEICFEKVMAQAGKNQVLIFVHSRADTIKTARALKEMAIDQEVVEKIVREDSATKQVLLEEAESGATKSEDLKEILPYGFAIHHAGLARSDRNLVEDLFADKHVQVLVSTATLAWGVNLPAHTVIIKGTQMYNPKEGKWVELSPLDVQQMLGRAGRPQYDSEGEGIIITQHSELQYYLSLMNQQLPVESQMVSKLADNLNAEIVQGSVQNVAEAVEWLGYTYLYVRMLRNPALYGIPVAEVERDQVLRQRRADLVHSAALLLEKSQLVKYDRRSGIFQGTPLGRVAAHYYITHESMATYNQYMRPEMSDIEILRLFSLSSEFSQIHVRQDEKLELQKLAQRVPIPIKEGLEEPSAKVNALMQTYISRLRLEGFALLADMTYVHQSAARILRALFEIALKRCWAQLANKVLKFCHMVERRCWPSQSPLRQFKQVPDVILRKLEKKTIPWERYYDLRPADLGELVKMPKMGKVLHLFVHQFPKLELQAHVQPITRSLLRVEAILRPDFRFDTSVHEHGLVFHVQVEDVDCETILHHETFFLRSSLAAEEHSLAFTVPIHDPLPPQYFIRVTADRWLHSETLLPISFRHLVLPSKFAPPTELLDLQPMPVSAIGDAQFEDAFYSVDPSRSELFNPVQTQTFQELYSTDHNVLVCAPVGSNLLTCAEFAVVRHLLRAPADSKIVYIAPKAIVAQHTFERWQKMFSVAGPLKDRGVEVSMLQGSDTIEDVATLNASKIVVASAAAWDMVTRKWRKRDVILKVGLVICDRLHLLGSEFGPQFEVVLARMRLIESRGGSNLTIRMVGLGASLANATDVAAWLGVTSKGLFNFHPSVRPEPLMIQLHGFEIGNYSAMMLAVSKPLFSVVRSLCAKRRDKNGLVFVPSSKQCKLTAVDIFTYARSTDVDFLSAEDKIREGLERVLPTVQDPTLAQTLRRGVGFITFGMKKGDLNRVRGLFLDGVIRIVVCPAAMSWNLQLRAYLVCIVGTQQYDSRSHGLVDYRVADLLDMVGRAGRSNVDDEGRAHIFTHANKKDFLRKVLSDPLPIESHLDQSVHDYLNTDIQNEIVQSKDDAVDWFTWTLFYRRVAKNPNYYGIAAATNEGISEYLSELVENTVGDLEESGCVAVEDDRNLVGLNLGMIAAYHGVSYNSIEIFAASVKAKTKLRGVLEIVTAATELESICTHLDDSGRLARMTKHIAMPLPAGATSITRLLCAYISRLRLPAEMQSDAEEMSEFITKLIRAFVDVAASSGFLKPALGGVELLQCVSVRVWQSESELLQLPHFTKERCERIKKTLDASSVYDVTEMEDDERTQALAGLAPPQIHDVADFCNRYPSLEVTHEVRDPEEIYANDMFYMDITLEREGADDDDDEDDEDDAGEDLRDDWYVLVGHEEKMLGIKKITVGKEKKLTMGFSTPKDAGNHTVQLFVMSLQYIGADQEFEVELKVQEEQDDDDDDSDDDDDDDDDGDGKDGDDSDDSDGDGDDSEDDLLPGARVAKRFKTAAEEFYSDL